MLETIEFQSNFKKKFNHGELTPKKNLEKRLVYNYHFMSECKG